MRRTTVLLAVLCLAALAAGDVANTPATGTHQTPIDSRETVSPDGLDAITIPRMLSYQGKLTDTLGTPVPNGNYSVSFRLYTVPSGGSPFWNETRSVTTKDGLFSVLLGSSTPIGSMPDAGAVYLGMAVGGGAELAPRLRIVSAAYAYKADSAAYAAAARPAGAAGGDLAGTYPDPTVDGLQGRAVAITAPAAGQVLKWTGTQWAPRNDSVGGGGIPDSIPGSLAIGGELRVHSKARLGYSCYNDGAAAFCAGYGNSASGDRSSVTGGEDNMAGGRHSHVGGGSENVASFIWSAVGGGNLNEAADTAATISGGQENVAGDKWATVGGGYGNSTSGLAAVVGGGNRNTASGRYNTVGGGYLNTTERDCATVGGGSGNLASSYYSTVSGGGGNTASDRAATVGGGTYNIASASYATVGGGDDNTAGDTGATVAGGLRNTASGQYATVAGGLLNTVSGAYATVGGGRNDTARGYVAGVLSGMGNAAGDGLDDTAAVVAGGIGNRSTGKCATVAGGGWNSVSGSYATAGGGSYNSASDDYATVAGGNFNFANNSYATVGGGAYNTTSGSYSTVAGGRSGSAGGNYATVAGGYQNTASGNYATVAGGYHNVAQSYYSAVPGGYACSTSAYYAFAAGYSSKAGHSNSAAFNGQTTTASSQTRVGALSKASGTFTIDHPLDPHGKILNHYFIEGPEMRNIYDGEAVLDASGRAVVVLPGYFDALNRKPRVQLTGVGSPDVHLAEKVSGNRFVIAGPPGVEVYWQVTGERRDVSAEATRRMMPVEQSKTGVLAGRMLDDEFISGCMDQLVREGKAQGIDFRTAAGRQRYEQAQQHLREAGQE